MYPLANHIKIAKSKEKASMDYLSDLKIEWNRKFTLSYRFSSQVRLQHFGNTMLDDLAIIAAISSQKLS